MASQAWAEPVTLAPVSYSPEFQAALEEDLGQREGAYLSTAIEHAVSDALARRGATVGEGAPLLIETTIVDADPNRPTFEQLANTPGLDYMRSVSIGGAELHAVLRGADGRVLTEISHRRYNHSLEDLVGVPTTWTAARQAIRQFANKVADAYVEQSR
jgi:hypothetical protein